MKLTIFNPPLPAKASATPSTLAESKEAFEKKLGTLRIATGRPERFVSLCACAVHDRPFTVVYERSDPARPFTIVGIYKGDESKDGESGSARMSTMKTLPVSEVDATGWRCPHCLADWRHIACDRCGTTVCGGRTRAYPGTPEIFECRASCGVRSTLQEAQSVQGIQEVRKPVPAKPSAPLRDRLPSPTQDTLRLGPPPGGRRT